MQRGIEAYYGLERAPGVATFLRPAEEGARESVRIRESGDGVLELEVVAPRLSAQPDLDSVCQLIEGVSHFLYVAERARCDLPATELELEFQAEVDKYVLLALSSDPPTCPTQQADRPGLHARLFDRVRFVDPPGSVAGERYRLANQLSSRLVHRLEATYVRTGRLEALRRVLARFYRMGQSEKIAMALAA